MKVERYGLGNIGEHTEVHVLGLDIGYNGRTYGDGNSEYLSTATDPQMNSARALVV